MFRVFYEYNGHSVMVARFTSYQEAEKYANRKNSHSNCGLYYVECE